MNALHRSAVLRLLTLLTISLILIGLSGCTAVQLGYRNADTLLYWRGGQYFDFDGEPRFEYERRVQRFLAWHRRVALPQYSRLAEEAATRLARGLSQADLVWGYDSFQVLLQQSLHAGTGELGDLLDGLTPAQIETFDKRLAKENREYAKEYRLGDPPQERRGARVKRNVERLEGWFGSLTEEQLERVRLYSARAPLDDAMRERDRKRLQNELLAMLRAKETKQKLREWAVNWDQNRDPAFEAARKQNLQEYFGMLLDLDKTLSAEQRTRAVRRLRGFAEDFNALAARGGAK